MKKCPRCSAEFSGDQQNCRACGWSAADESAETAISGESPDQTPTRVKHTKASPNIHTTSGAGRFSVGEVLDGRFQILGLLGAGGMGEVYKAEDLELKQTVAVKFLPEELSSDNDLLERFRGEVRNARQVSHPNVCRVFDIRETNGLYYISMEFIEGDDLSMLLSRIGRLPSDKAVEISREIAMGLNAIHKAGILHRDLKPANIIIDSKGRARITDFGIAGLESEVQGEESRVGTPAYMSPEQISGEEVTVRSDIYSLGLLLYEIFTGKQAFIADNVPALLEMQKNGTPTRASEIVTGIDPLVEDLILKCLEKDPAKRPSSALQVAMTLPGGNPLQVALEAGETPTPDMVAAAPDKGTLRPLIGLALTLGVIGLFTLTSYFTSMHSISGATPFDRTPEALAEEARSSIRNLGYTEQAADSVYFFEQDLSFLSFADQQDKPREWFDRLGKGQPFGYSYHYRQSPGRMVPSGLQKRISAENPPMTTPGMVSIRLDVTGRLVSFKAVPPAQLPSGGSSGSTDWNAVFSEAGLELKDFETIEPEVVPSFHSDEIRRWKGTLPDFPDVPVRINGASLGGKVVEFDVVPVWKEPAGATDTPQGLSGELIFVYILMWTLLIASLFVARHNIKHGRGDLSGAVKLGAFCFALHFAATLLYSDYIPAAFNFSAPITSVSVFSIESGLTMSLYYLAMEPYVRRSWPEGLISWNRLLTGELRNPMIGRDLLIGMSLGAVYLVLKSFVVFAVIRWSPDTIELPFDENFFHVLLGPSQMVSGMLVMINWALLNSFVWLFIMIFFLIIFKKRKLAVIATLVLVTAQDSLGVVGGEPYHEFFLDLAFSALVIFLLQKYGILAATGYFLVYFLVFYFPVTLDPSRFYFSYTIGIIALISAIAIYSFYIASGKQVVEALMSEPEGG